MTGSLREIRSQISPLPGTIGRAVARCVLAIAGLAFICNVGTLTVPLFNMQVFNRVLPTRDVDTMGALTAGLGIAILTFAVLDFFRGVAQEILARRVVRQLSLPLIHTAAISKRPDLAAAEGLADLETLRTFLSGRACMVPFDIAWAPILLLALLIMHWALGLFAAACLAVMVGLNFLGDAVSRKAILVANHASAEAMRGAADGINAAEALIALGIAPVLLSRWQYAQEHASNLVRHALLRARGVSAVTSALRASMTGAMVALGLSLALSGMASSGSMVAANMILARLLMPFTTIAGSRRQWIDTLAAWRRVKAALAESAPRRLTGAVPVEQPRLIVEKLGFVPAGGDRALLRNISFTVEAGESIAVIGPSSAGKSTLVRMLMGMAAPTQGGVYLDGHNTYLWERSDFARHIGFLPQQAQLLEETIADNIARMQTPDMAAVMAAAKKVGLHRTIAALPHGYSTVVIGGLLSGGQRQRLALARALYRKPKVLILDEPTAFLDEVGEADVACLLQELRREGVTLLTVTHRPALLKVVDKVLVLKDGMIAQFAPVIDVASELGRRMPEAPHASASIALP